MSPAAFIKHYTDPARCAAALTHLEWLDQLDSGVRLPRLHARSATRLVLNISMAGTPAQLTL